MSEANAGSLANPSSQPPRGLVAAVGGYMRRHGQGNRVLALLLICLHAAMVWGQGKAWGQGMILAHYGLFLLWQPFFSGQLNLPWPRALGVLAVGMGLAFLGNIWASALWAVLLAGLLGGVAVGVKSLRERLGLWLGVLYLLLLLFTWMLPQGFGLPVLDGGQPSLLRDGLLLLPLCLALLPPPRYEQRAGVLDLLYTLLFVLVIGVLALGSYTAMQLSHTSYAQGVAISVGTLLVSLLIVAWLWQPRGETPGLRHLFSRYVLSLGLPLEQWLKELSDAAEREADPDLFLRAAMAGFTHLPWSTGVTWHTSHTHGEFGSVSRHAVSFSHQGVEVTFYTDAPVNPAFALHLRLLTEIIGYFHAAKTRERALQANAYTQAIYETGSRLTHDVKNLLQSLKTLCSAAEHSLPSQATSLQTLMQRQLPQIAKRLEITLDKLKSPEKTADRREILAREWWHNLKLRYARDNLNFRIDEADTLLWLPQELFESVADNLIQNALRKRVGQPEVGIRVELRTEPVPSLIVCDSGEAAAPEVVEKLFHAPVSTHDGLGIGLYQAAKQAGELGYGLELSRNNDGEVCFTLWQERL
ncbi:MAG: sensor histidine kinase [Thiobacillaceae bacterium]|jgi:signal transduction histidine kinase|nr:sensor histidine kinase [Thiobacillaceae bacterium]